MMLTAELFYGADALFGRTRQPVFELRVPFRVLVERDHPDDSFHDFHLTRHCSASSLVAQRRRRGDAGSAGGGEQAGEEGGGGE
jgi:hypothetical protein